MAFILEVLVEGEGDVEGFLEVVEALRAEDDGKEGRDYRLQGPLEAPGG